MAQQLIWSSDGTTLVAITRDAFWHYQVVPELVLLQRVEFAGQVYESNQQGSSRYIPLIDAAAATLQIYTVDTLTEVARMRGDFSRVSTVALLPDSSRLVIGSYEGEIQLIDFASGEIRPFARLQQAIYTLAMSADGVYLAAGGADLNRVTLWNLQTDDPAQVLTIPDTGTLYTVNKVTFSPDSQTLAVARASGTRENLHLFNLKAEKIGSSALSFRLDQAKEVRFSPDGTYLATASFEAVRVWEIASPDTPVVDLQDFHGLTRLAFHPGSRTLALAHEGGVEIVKLPSGAMTRLLPDHAGLPVDFAVAPDSQTIAVLDLRGTVGLYDLQTRTAIRVWSPDAEGRLSTAQRIAFSSEGNWLAVTTGFRTRTTYLLDAASGKTTQTLSPFSSYDVVFLAKQATEYLLVADWGALFVWQMPAGKEVFRRDFGMGTLTFAISPDGARVAVGMSGSAMPPLRLLDLETWRVTAAFGFGVVGQTQAVAFHPFEPVLASIDGQQLALWDLQDLENPVPTAKVVPMATLPYTQGNYPAASQLNFSPDGSLLGIIAGHRLSLYDSYSLELSKQVPADRFAFSSDGTLLITLTAGVVRLWSIDPASG